MIIKILMAKDVKTILDAMTDYHCLYYDDTLYISDIRCDHDIEFTAYVKQMSENNGLCVKLNESEYSFEPTQVQIWLAQEKLWADTIRYEQEEQDALQQAMQSLDRIEQYLIDYIVKRGDDHGRTEEKTRQAAQEEE